MACVPDDFQVMVDAVQCRVDAAAMLSTVVAEHSAWMRDIGVLDAGASFAAVTWSDWDLKVCACTGAAAGCDVQHRNMTMPQATTYLEALTHGCACCCLPGSTGDGAQVAPDPGAAVPAPLD